MFFSGLFSHWRFLHSSFLIFWFLTLKLFEVPPKAQTGCDLFGLVKDFLKVWGAGISFFEDLERSWFGNEAEVSGSVTNWWWSRNQEDDGQSLIGDPSGGASSTPSRTWTTARPETDVGRCASGGKGDFKGRWGFWERFIPEQKMKRQKRLNGSTFIWRRAEKKLKEELLLIYFRTGTILAKK